MTEYPAAVYDVEVRWSDQDLMGHVNNATVLTLIEEARVRWYNDTAGFNREINPTVVAHMDLNYRRPVHYGPTLRIELGVGRVGRTSYSITCRGIQDDAVVFDGTHVLVGVDPEKHAPRELTDAERETLGRYGTFDPEKPTDLSAAPVDRP